MASPGRPPDLLGEPPGAVPGSSKSSHGSIPLPPRHEGRDKDAEEGQLYSKVSSIIESRDSADAKRRVVYLMNRISIALIFLLQGCDFTGGLARFAQLEGKPLTRQCVERALESVHGLSDIRYSQPEFYKGNRHRFDYVVEGIQNKLLYEEHNNTHYWNGYSFLNTVPGCEDIEIIRPYLLEIDKSIERECHTTISVHIEEGLSRTACDVTLTRHRLE
jgi:hypothetical protein